MFFGREDTLSEMQALWGKRVGSLVTCRGRRRIGKSTLIEEFARRSDARFINIEGIRPDGKVDNEAECVKFWGDSVSRISEREILDVLSITGGIPRYLEEINPALTADENIRLMCFRQKSPLRIDFDEMFRDVIVDQPAFTERVLRCLVSGPKTATELAKELGVAKNGHISAACERLAEAGFVSPDPGRNPESGALVREVKYRLRDNYTRFYLKYIEPVKSIIDAGSYEFVSLRQLEGWNAVTGLAFENLVVNHYREFLPALGLANALVVSAAPYRKGPDKRRRTRGCQIDLLIQTKQTVCLVEIKRRKSIGNEVVKSMDAALSCLLRPKGVSFRTALVYSGSLAATVSAGGYFNSAVDVGKMLGIR